MYGNMSRYNTTSIRRSGLYGSGNTSFFQKIQYPTNDVEFKILLLKVHFIILKKYIFLHGLNIYS